MSGAAKTAPVSDADHQLGSPDAPVTLVEYGDYQCSDCRAAHVIVKDLRRALGDNLRLVFRHFPLRKVHEQAWLAAEAAEAAAAQGAFWAYHDRLYANQEALSRDDLLAHGAALGLDAGAIARALDAGTFTAEVRSDFLSGVHSDVNGTPTFFINGRRYDGLQTFTAMVAALQAAMDEAGEE